MSVMSMAQLASNPTRRPRPASESDTERGLRLIAAYIPSEALAAYLALLGLMVPAVGTPTGQVLAVKAIVLLAGLGLSIALIFLGFKPGANDDAATSRRKRILLIGFAFVAFLAYSLATPGGPWSGGLLGIPVTVWGAAAALILAPLLPALAQRWGLRPS
jgi:hypothetical protein